jgi:hypothetical protein
MLPQIGDEGMKKGDWLLIVMLIVVAVSVLASNKVLSSVSGEADGAKKAEISLDGEIYQMIELSGQDGTIEIRTERGYDRLRVHDNGIEVVESDCPEKICISMGFIDRVGETIICLPNRMIVEIVGDGGDRLEVDAIST